MVKIEDNNFIIRENLKKAIANSGRKKSWIAKEIGISYSSLWRQLNGSRNLKAETVIQIALLTGKTPNEIYGFNAPLGVLPKMKSSIAQNIKVIRRKKGINQTELANATGLSRNTIVNFETGRVSPKVDDLRKIANALSVPIEQLISDSELEQA